VHFSLFLYGALESVTVLRRLINRRCIIIITIIITHKSSNKSQPPWVLQYQRSKGETIRSLVTILLIGQNEPEVE